MSSSNAAAIRRRVGAQGVPAPAPTPNTPTSSSTSTTSSAPAQMTLQQVITTVDKRLTQLETIVQSNNNNATNNNESSDLPLVVVVDEFNNRFELIVTEINSLKDIVMKLQSYTMEVNKMLVDERIHILSDLGNNSVTSSNAGSRVRASSPNSVDLKKMVEQELNNAH